MLPYLLLALPCVLRLVKARNYDLNHTHFIVPDGGLSWLLRRLTGLRYVITAHGTDVPGYNPDRFRLQHRLLAPLWKRVVRNAECIVCPSRHLQGLLLDHCNITPTTVIPNGLRAERFNPERAREMRVLVVTRMFERKGVQYLLQALDGVNFAYPVNIVGDGPYLEALKHRAQTIAADIRFHGWIDNASGKLQELYETSTIFVFTSQQENFPVNLLEAMAAGMAIITSTDPGSREVVGDAAVIVEAREPGRLRAALEGLARDPQRCSALGHRARQRFEALFTWPCVSARYQELFGKLTDS
jgi:glycosyltransferase involved in cell wall biosynthesis